MTYYCNNCKRFVDEDDLVGTGEFFKAREHGACPHCHSEDLVEANECDICGKPIEQFEQFCEDCREKLGNAWSEGVNYLIKETGKDPISAEQWLINFIESEVF